MGAVELLSDVDITSEYAAVRNGGAGLIDLSSRGRLLVSGSESLQFLNGLITNDMKTLEPNRWMAAAFPNVQGRLVAAVRVLHLKWQQENSGLQTNGYLIDTEAPTHEAVLKTIGRFTLAGDFHVTNLTQETRLLSIQGAKASELIGEVFSESAGALERGQVLTTEFGNQPVCLIRATHTSEDGFDLVIAASVADQLREELISGGATPVGEVAAEVLRIEAGEARFGIDMDETNVVSEINLDDAISFTKGCYIGQEIIARIKYRGHVAKKLVGLIFAGIAEVKPGAKLVTSEGKEIGRITSVTGSPMLERTIGLGYLKYDYLAPGTEVLVADQDLKASVVELPFVKGSWQTAAATNWV